MSPLSNIYGPPLSTEAQFGLTATLFFPVVEALRLSPDTLKLKLRKGRFICCVGMEQPGFFVGGGGAVAMAYRYQFSVGRQLF